MKIKKKTFQNCHKFPQNLSMCKSNIKVKKICDKGDVK